MLCYNESSYFCNKFDLKQIEKGGEKNMKYSLFNKKGFTLIELLIVVAIIAILAAIAIPNFLQAQVRAKVSRTQADMASMATAIEAYCVDNSWYPLYGHVERTLTVEYPAT